MALRVVPPTDWMDDPGCWEKLYPVPKHHELQSILYDKEIQRTSYIQANIVACFDEWIRSFFTPDYFVNTRIKTQSTFSEFKSWMKKIYKKEKPLMVIDPRSIEHVEDSLFGQNMINRYNIIDPNNEAFGAKLLYSLQIMKDEMFEIVYRRNRYRFEFDVMFMENTLDRQMNLYNMLIMNIRHNSKFLLHRVIPFLLPIKYVRNIANMKNMDYKSDQFVAYLNSISKYPIIRRVLPNGLYMFFFQVEMNIQVEVPGLPSKDSPEMSGAIEWGARVVDSFTFIADLPSEYLFMIPEEFSRKYDRSIPCDPDNINYISPITADLDWPTEYGDYKLTNRIDIMMQEGDDNHFDLKPVIARDDPEIHATIMEFYQRAAGDIGDLVMVRVYPNGSYREAGFTVSETGILTITDPKPDKLYTVNVYVNLHTVNLIREGKHKKFIGNIEKY